MLLFVGHNFPLKGLATVIRAVGRLARAGGLFEVAVLGGGRPRRYSAWPNVAAPAAPSGSGSAIDDPLPYYAAADVCVQPTFYDSFGLTVLEAAACGLPSITSRFAGVSELIERRPRWLCHFRSGR